MSESTPDFETWCLHGKSESALPYGATSVPIVQSTGFVYSSADEMEQVFRGRKMGYLYSRISNPTVTCLEERLNYLENGVGTIATSSGMAAISVGLLSVLKSGDSMVAGNSLFGGTLGLFADLFSRWGIEVHRVESTDVAAFEKAITEKTKLVFLESIGNPKLDVPDLNAISQLAHARHCPVFVDNTAATPFLCKPREWGADFIIHSVSKYLNGNGNAIGGTLTDAGTFTFDHEKYEDFKPFIKRFGPMAFLAKARKQVFINLGPCLGPQNAFLQMLGLETLTLRMEKHCANALALASFLDKEASVKKVCYPGLAHSPSHTVAKKQMPHGFGGLLCLDMGTRDFAFKVLNALKVVKRIANIGDARTLALHPGSTIYADFSDEDKLAAGVTDGLIRVSVGLESEKDIIQDFKQALDQLD